MEQQQRSPLLVDLYLEQARITGRSFQVGERRRLVDVLNANEDAIQLEDVNFAMLGGQVRQLPKVMVEKRAIIAAIPRETSEQSRQRMMERNVMGHATTQPLNLTMIIPPFVAEGTAHLLGGRLAVRKRLRADPDLFTRFFSVTDGRLFLPDGSVLEAPVILLNRDNLVALSLDEAA